MLWKLAFHQADARLTPSTIVARVAVSTVPVMQDEAANPEKPAAAEFTAYRRSSGVKSLQSGHVNARPWRARLPEHDGSGVHLFLNAAKACPVPRSGKVSGDCLEPRLQARRYEIHKCA